MVRDDEGNRPIALDLAVEDDVLPLKRVLIQAAGCNLGLLLRRLTGVGTPRSLQGRALSAICGLIGRLTALWGRLTASWDFQWTPAGLVSAQSLIAKLPEQAGSANSLLPRAVRGHIRFTSHHITLSASEDLREHCPSQKPQIWESVPAHLCVGSTSCYRQAS